MKVIIFAGGVGTRLWPLSRKAFPKQFIKMFNGKSTIELAVERVKKFGYENIYISTAQAYIPLVKKYFPKLSPKNIIGEPELRNVAPAIGYSLIVLRKRGYKGPVAVLWADHLIKDEKNFVPVLKKGETLIADNPNRLVFVGVKPRFANNNLGWIQKGEKIDDGVHKFMSWKYRPEVQVCKEMFNSGEWFWNPGYFIMDVDYVLSLYKKFQPKMYTGLRQIEKSIGGKNEKKTISRIYPTLEKIHFDTAIAEKIPPHNAIVIEADLEGWSDPGTLYALKEALSVEKDANLARGRVSSFQTKDSLIINEEKNKLVATVGLEGFVVVNTKDVLLVVPKDKVREVTELLNQMASNKKHTKFL